VYQQQEQEQEQQQQQEQQDAENPFLDPPFSRIKTGADDDNPLLRVIVFRVDKRFCRIIQSENGIDGNARKKFALEDQSLRRNLGTVFRQKLKVPLSLARPSRPKRK
jgi:hypothetical protein